MNHYMKLVNYEINRFVKVYLSLLLITFISQFAGVLISSVNKKNDVKRIMFEQSWSMAEYIHHNGKISFLANLETLWFLGPIAVCAAAMIFYIFLIWYRDWFGKNTFIYRLLMLPTSRLNIFFAKATAIFLMVLGFIAFQIVLLPLQNGLFQWIVPEDYIFIMNLSEIMRASTFISMIIPNTFSEFLAYYGLGFIAILVVFTAILFERSYRWKGIVIGILYIILAGAVFLFPLIIMVISERSNLFYPLEFLLLEIGLGLLVTFTSIWISKFLLNRKITV
ncbi:hypothetical protein J7E81_26760 [Bacillus sp. ISL-18]|uniref:hypothetical protein n=1 Tax=Bacillus sp. ISL-18 TaxID=2819118 RepID=UPI001BE6192B|nr:hypothetical protein [Bacillus sp. ISL-18]MBT2658780.1 hypothetical protein [Bacillus sp. ISL-18]